MTEPSPSKHDFPVAEAARMLGRAGQIQITEAMLEADQKAGAPVNPDGTVNLIHYVAWLAREANNGP